MTPALKAIETEHQPDATSLYTRLQAVRSPKCILVITVERQPVPSYGVKTSQSTSKWSVTGIPPINKFESTLGQKKSRSPNFDGADKETGPRNPKIAALVNEIINDNSLTQDQSEPPENQLAATDVFQSSAQIPRAKGDIIGYSDDEVSSTKLKYLPATVDGLLKRFNKLYKEFTQGRHEH